MSSQLTHSHEAVENAPQTAWMMAQGGGTGVVVRRGRAPQVAVNPVITVPQTIIVVKKSHTNPARVALRFSASARFTRSGTLQLVTTPTSGSIRLFTSARGTTEIVFVNNQHTFTAAELNAGVSLFAQSDSPSAALNDIQLTLTLAPGPTPVGPPAQATLTAVSLTLTLSPPRATPGAAFAPLPEPPAAGTTPTDKWFGGATLNAQDAGNNQLRAQLVVGQVVPAAFAGDLILRQVKIRSNNINNSASGLDNKAQLFDSEIPGSRQTPTVAEVPKANPFIFNAGTITSAAGLTLFVEGRNASASARDTGFQLGINGVENDGDRVALTVGVAPVITLATQTVLVKKSYTAPARQAVTLRTGTAFNRTGTLTRSSNRIRFFTAATAGTEITFNGTDNQFPGARLTAGVQIFAEGNTASAALNDVQLTLTLTPGASPPAGVPVTVTMTSVDLTLDIFMTRTAAGVDPAPFAQPPAVTPAPGTGTDKWFGGRFIHQQDTGNHHGRALIIVRQVQPATFGGDLSLRQLTVAADVPGGLINRAQLFDNERPTGGEAAKANPHVFNASTVPAAGIRFFAEGTIVSPNARDIGFQLGLSDGEPDGDRARLTVMRFSNLQASVTATPPRTARSGNSPVGVHTLTRGAAALTASDFDVDFTANPPLILLENSVQAATPVNLSVVVAPVGVPVSWSVLRDTRAAPNGDHASIVALSANASPTITRNAANPLTATLLTDCVGSFHIRPFVDINGNNSFDAGIDFEPFMIMNLVLVRVTLNVDNSLSPGANFARTPDTTAPAGVIRVPGGPFNIAAPAGDDIHMNAQADLVGGGDDGLRGVSSVFAGWVNNESANEDIVGTYQDTTVAPPVNHTNSSVFASNTAAATGRGPTFLPGDPAPVLVAPSLLDSGRPAPGIGGDTACLSRSRIRTRTTLRTAAAPAAVGQRILVEAVDSPGDGEGPTHPGFAAARLIRFKFGLDFSAFLCFWTNITGASGATGDPSDRLYSVLLQVDWRMRGEWTINPTTGVIAVVTAPTVTSATRTTTSPAVAAVARPVEVRFPTGLNLLARDGRA